MRPATLVVLAGLLAFAAPALAAAPQTASARGVILSGQFFVDVPVPLPSCAKPENFLVQGVDVGPEIVIGNTTADVVNLPNWGASVPVYQQFPAGSQQVALTVLGSGPVHLSAAIPAGQSTLPIPDAHGHPTLPVRIVLLGGKKAAARFEFNVQVWGFCGRPFITP